MEREQEPTPVHEKNWLEKMNGFLNWKIIGPDINNPYAPVMSDRLLTDLANKQEKLRSLLALKCLCDGYEVLLIKNLVSPYLKTDHPCLSILSKDEIFRFLRENGMDERIDQEIERIQKDIREELQRREQEELDNPHTKYGKVLKKRDEVKDFKRSSSTQYRILKKS